MEKMMLFLVCKTGKPTAYVAKCLDVKACAVGFPDTISVKELSKGCKFQIEAIAELPE